MHRFFVSPSSLHHHPVTLTGDAAFQMRRVLRLRLGERVILLDGLGRACEALLIALGDEQVELQVVRRWQAEGEPATHVTLYQAVLKGDHFAWALQKGVEVGVSAFVPTLCERNVVDDLAGVEAKRGRWERVIREAAEQSGRARLPELRAAQLFGHAVAPAPQPGGGSSSPGSRGAKGDPAPPEIGGPGGADTRAIRLIPYEGEHAITLRAALAGCNWAEGMCIQVFIGPEGGFSEAEIATARRNGVQPVTLGPRILRAETAGVVAAALILYEASDI